uniref:Isoaspartyl peptidase/L-asparaginase n=1 Tax=Sinocyclocheilus grahami TaxID=75366 RepID=A0A672RB45_SINGR
MLPAMVEHGGAGHIPKERAELSTIGVKEAARTGYAILQGWKVSRKLRLCPYVIGRGSVLNVMGEVEMDAMVMDVQLARLVMEKLKGPLKFARSMGVPEVPEESLITDYAKMRWKKNLQPDAKPVECQMGKMGTVSAVAVDKDGNIASATSTGGMINKIEGRVGDTPCVGCGGYADNNIGAVSPTGHGEAIMKVTLSRLILFHMEQGKTPEEASDLALTYMKERVDGLCGVVVVDPKGTWAARFSSLQMSWAAAQQGELHYGLYRGEHFVEPVQENI